MWTENVFHALLISTAAGLATLAGAVIIYIIKDKNERLISASLGLAAGVMICVAFHDLWPHSEAYFTAVYGEQIGLVWAVVFLVTGVLLAAVLDRLVPHEAENNALGGEHHDLFRLGFISMIAIGLHNLPEGMATFIANYENAGVGTTVALAIALHNIPEGITVAMPIYFSTHSKSKTLFYTFLAGIAEPIGALIAFSLLRIFLNDFTMGIVFAIAAGIMLYIAIEELLPSSRQYGYKRAALIATFAGITIMPLVHLIS